MPNCKNSSQKNSSQKNKTTPKNMKTRKSIKIKTLNKFATKKISPIPSPSTTKIKSSSYPWISRLPLAGSKAMTATSKPPPPSVQVFLPILSKL